MSQPRQLCVRSSSSGHSNGSRTLVYSSDLARAQETAEIVACQLGLAVRLDPRLREGGFGSWEGLTGYEIEERDADALARWQANARALMTPSRSMRSLSGWAVSSRTSFNAIQASACS
jgi:broad specificity phosphatase PhoE